MSDVNATPEIPPQQLTPDVPGEPAVAQTPGVLQGAEAPGEPLTGSTVTSNQLPDTPVTPTTVPVSEVHAALLRVHDALQNVSLTEALNRFYAYAKSIKALAGE